MPKEMTIAAVGQQPVTLRGEDRCCRHGAGTAAIFLIVTVLLTGCMSTDPARWAGGQFDPLRAAIYECKETANSKLAWAAGFFLYVATTDFLPEATHAPRRYFGRQALFLIIGILVIATVRALFPEIGH